MFVRMISILDVYLVLMMLAPSQQECEIESLTSYKFVGGYYDSTTETLDGSKPFLGSIETQSDGRSILYFDINDVPVVNIIPYFDMFLTFAKFTSSSDSDANCAM